MTSQKRVSAQSEIFSVRRFYSENEALFVLSFIQVIPARCKCLINDERSGVHALWPYMASWWRAGHAVTAALKAGAFMNYIRARARGSDAIQVHVRLQSAMSRALCCTSVIMCWMLHVVACIETRWRRVHACTWLILYSILSWLIVADGLAAVYAYTTVVNRCTLSTFDNIVQCFSLLVVSCVL